ncbi:TatD family hydrolase [Haloferax denitrificans]|uniref:Putative metal-dependent hydrolase n=1 Tax=Haloferax denitrificans ATCC 35960 TaxID=662478 RepID=M0J744_9EURY|nr:TatD family hydrolase [Haloferax denitrificans]EMA04168.1 putative metal-dependent hydrolase [Haloferax denitrificans ATCC 35960]
MQEFDTPVVDNHLHLDPDHGRGLEAVKDFARSGGTHLLVVNKPSWLLGHEVETGEDFRPVFETTVEVVREATEILPGRAWPVLGVHPGLVSKLVDDRGYDPEAARDLMCAGLDTAAEFVREGDALALKSGRPHYEVTDAVWEASNAVLRHGLDLAADCDCALQLHTESTTDLSDVAEWADERGVPGERVVKHYAQGHLTGGTPSVMSDKDRLEDAAERGDPFLMETDFIDDPDRPGAVMGPKTVPRRVDWLLDEGRDAAVRNAHVETPASVYGVDTEATLDR